MKEQTLPSLRATQQIGIGINPRVTIAAVTPSSTTPSAVDAWNHEWGWLTPSGTHALKTAYQQQGVTHPLAGSTESDGDVDWQLAR
ncbi:hypothetical protein [Limnohabitans sp. T6-5]|uniref:hypothetical protein n=1 Tax=Limnohabitans sp. T6-5 TaxID=1100724 RepID=UPI001E426FDB|nr:hypothetical protein [Limnohabitans sp. T6-5]